MSQTPAEIKDIKRAVRERDGYRCIDCGINDQECRHRHGKGLEVHRISPGSAYSLEGCQSLCKRCHGFKPRRPRKPRPASELTEIAWSTLPIGFTARLDRIRKKRGLSRAAYIRQAVLMLLADDEGQHPAD